MELKNLLIVMCVCFMSSTCITAVLIPSTQCHIFERKAPKPIANGRIRVFDVDVTPIPIVAGYHLNVKFNAFRDNKQVSENPNENVRAHMTLSWKGAQVSQTIQGEIKPSEYNNDYPVLCKHITSPNCPIAIKQQFSVSLNIHVPTDVLLSDMWLKIQLKNNRNQLLGCYLAHVQHAILNP